MRTTKAANSFVVRGLPTAVVTLPSYFSAMSLAPAKLSTNQFAALNVGEPVFSGRSSFWTLREDEWGAFFDDSNAVFPINKVRKQFQNGREDSILSFFEVIREVFKQPQVLLV